MLQRILARPALQRLVQLGKLSSDEDVARRRRLYAVERGALGRIELGAPDATLHQRLEGAPAAAVRTQGADETVAHRALAGQAPVEWTE
eukprot:3000935-Rhodomonas_salina.5